VKTKTRELTCSELRELRDWFTPRVQWRMKAPTLGPTEDGRMKAPNLGPTEDGRMKAPTLGPTEDGYNRCITQTHSCRPLSINVANIP